MDFGRFRIQMNALIIALSLAPRHPHINLTKKVSLLSTSKSPLQAAYERSAAQLSKVKQHRELECGSIDENMAFTIEWVCVAAAAAISVAL